MENYQFYTILGMLLGGFGWMVIRMDKSAESVKRELKSDISDLRTELRSDISDLRTELKSDISDLRTELKSDIDDLKSDIKEVSNKVTSLETRVSRVEVVLECLERYFFDAKEN